MSWFYPKRKAKTVSGGIRLTRASEHRNTWWGQRWIESLSSFTSAKRLERGLRLAKSGHVLSIHVEQGFAVAEVQGTMPRPYKVEIGLPMFTHKQWLRVTDSILKKAFYTAKLLSGEMPPEIAQIFHAAGAPLIPESQDDISSDCSCPDGEIPCKHIAAVIYILGQEIDRDPFLLMEMRGLGRAKLLAEIQARRSIGSKLSGNSIVQTPKSETPAQTNLGAHLNDFFRSPTLQRPATPTNGSDPKPPLPIPGGRVHEMGTPPFWQSDNEFEDVLTRIYQAVRKRALG